MRLTKIMAAVLLTLLAATALAGQLHPRLEARMDAISADEPLSVIVILADQAPVPQLNAQLKAERATLQQRHERVVSALRATADATQGPLTAWLDERMEIGNVTGYTAHWISNLIVVQATKDEIYALADRPDVESIEMNFTATLIEPVKSELDGPVDELGSRGIGVPPGLRAIKADRVWYELGYNGEGRLIGSLDTGVDGNHPALAGDWRGTHAPASECWLDLLGTGTTFPVDNNNHGTHTTGTMAGVAHDDTIGVAWGAEWIACNAINQGVSSGFDNDIIVAFEWFADPDGDPGTIDDMPDVVQNSWGIHEAFPGDYIDCDTRWWDAIDNCEAAGVVTVWSAGNEGDDYGDESLRSPADRATTLTNAFSVGAVDATNYSAPYPIAYFSSLGPSGCDVPAENKIKPEVSAPGVDVYSSVPGGGYNGTYDGTSMSGPHVAGVVALMRQANPDLDVDTIKTIIMATCIDYGDTGEDNTFGHGFINAYEAVMAATVGFGLIEGHVTNGSFGDSPIGGANIQLLDTTHHWTSASNGYYSGSAAAGVYTARATHPGFAPVEVYVDIVSNELYVADFSMTDIAGPVITNVTQTGTTTETAMAHRIMADIQDYSTVDSAVLYYRLCGGGWTHTPMDRVLGGYEGFLPAMPANTQYDYYVWAEDGIGQSSTEPHGAPLSYFTLYVTEEIYTHSAEDPGDPDWTMGVAGDEADAGIWNRMDPYATDYNGATIQPEDDHTITPGVACFVTDGNDGGSAGDYDVDHGCTTLLSPIFALSAAEMAFVTYWRWYGEGGNSSDDEFAVDISDDGGASWTPLERVAGGTHQWDRVVADIAALVDLTDQVQIRFLACDLDVGGLVEVAIDDFTIETFSADATAVPGEPFGPRLRLAQSRPNPFRPEDGQVSIHFNLGQSGSASLEIYDLAGRRVRVLARGEFPAGEQMVSWNGRDERGHQLSSGVYFYRLSMANKVESRRLILLR